MSLNFLWLSGNEWKKKEKEKWSRIDPRKWNVDTFLFSGPFNPWLSKFLMAVAPRMDPDLKEKRKRNRDLLRVQFLGWDSHTLSLLLRLAPRLTISSFILFIFVGVSGVANLLRERKWKELAIRHLIIFFYMIDPQAGLLSSLFLY